MSFRDVRPGLHGGNLLNCTVCGVDFTPATAGVVCRAYCKDCELRFLGAFSAQRATAALVRACKVAFMNERSHLAAFSCSSSRRRLQLAGCKVPAAGQAARCRLAAGHRLQATGCKVQAQAAGIKKVQVHWTPFIQAGWKSLLSECLACCAAVAPSDLGQSVAVLVGLSLAVAARVPVPT